MSTTGGDVDASSQLRGIMRNAFHAELDALTAGLAQMCGVVSAVVDLATRALLEADVTHAEEALASDERLNGMRRDIDEDALRLLALQNPVAGDLRSVVTVLHTSADVERMGELAVHIAKIARRRHPARAVPDDVVDVFSEMGRLATELATTAGDVVASVDPERAAELRREDDAMDALHRRLFEVMTDAEWTNGVTAAVDVTLLGRFYERFADHAVEIGRRVIFQATGSAV